MNKDIDSMIAVLQAAKEGQRLEREVWNASAAKKQWMDCDLSEALEHMAASLSVRIKPKPREIWVRPGSLDSCNTGGVFYTTPCDDGDIKFCEVL